MQSIRLQIFKMMQQGKFTSGDAVKVLQQLDLDAGLAMARRLSW